jgi:hypothetical protein
VLVAPIFRPKPRKIPHSLSFASRNLPWIGVGVVSPPEETRPYVTWVLTWLPVRAFCDIVTEHSFQTKPGSRPTNVQGSQIALPSRIGRAPFLPQCA